MGHSAPLPPPRGEARAASPLPMASASAVEGGGGGVPMTEEEAAMLSGRVEELRRLLEEAQVWRRGGRGRLEGPGVRGGGRGRLEGPGVEGGGCRPQGGGAQGRGGRGALNPKLRLVCVGGERSCTRF